MPASRRRRRGGDGLSSETAEVAERVGIDTLLTHKEVLEIVRVSRLALTRMRRTGDFPAPIQIPGTRSIAWRASVIREWMERAERGA